MIKPIKVLLVSVVTVLSFFQFWNTSALNNNPTAIDKAILNDSAMASYSIVQSGKSSYYGAKFHNRKTASGEYFDLFDFTAAHKKLPFGTIVKVTNKANNKTVLVRINDRGPFVKGRIIDLSYKAAKDINALGTPQVVIECFNNNELLKDYDSTYFVGYSTTQPLLIIKQNFVEFNDTTSNWNAAINAYVHNYEANSNAYIFVRNKKSKNTQYFIGSVNVNGVI